ncbi:hypothetical protein LZ30DRAFT_610473, partial [Colletotrichum cereale]
YDIHGTWDSKVRSLGPYAFAHTNLTEIDLGLELLSCNNIIPERFNMGLGFYGRSFTIKDPLCLAAKVVKILERDDVHPTLDEAAAVRILVSWDDQTMLKMKKDFPNRRCLGGIMVWAVDLDDGTLIGELGSKFQYGPAEDAALRWHVCHGGLGNLRVGRKSRDTSLRM